MKYICLESVQIYKLNKFKYKDNGFAQCTLRKIKIFENMYKSNAIWQRMFVNEIQYKHYIKHSSLGNLLIILLVFSEQLLPNSILTAAPIQKPANDTDKLAAGNLAWKSARDMAVDGPEGASWWPKSSSWVNPGWAQAKGSARTTN